MWQLRRRQQQMQQFGTWRIWGDNSGILAESAAWSPSDNQMSDKVAARLWFCTSDMAAVSCHSIGT
jgi:hypothetical protein